VTPAVINGYVIENARQKIFHEGVTGGGGDFEGEVFSDKVLEKRFAISSNAVSGASFRVADQSETIRQP
jgi:hypothetical protein